MLVEVGGCGGVVVLEVVGWSRGFISYLLNIFQIIGNQEIEKIN